MKEFFHLFVVLVLFGIIGGCPEKCTCSRTKIFCKDTSMKAMAPVSPTTTFLSMNGDIVNKLNRSFITKTGEDLITLKLINMQIQEIHPLTFYQMGKVESLTISRNFIQDIKPRAFLGLSKLYVLDLSINDIWNISSGVFEGLGALRHLNLSHNQLNIIYAGMFDGLRRFPTSRESTTPHTLDLSGRENYILKIDEGVFEGLCLFTKLKNIILRLSEKPVPRTIFRGLSALRILSVEGGNHWPAYTATSDTMRGLYSLTHLTIRDSFFPKLPNRFFQDLTLLRILNLGSNRINELESGCFFGLNNLSVLQLNDNRINILNNSVFEHLISLTKLNLSYNEITTIHENAFNGLHRLRFLDLSNNWFTALGGNRFTHLSFLKELDISNNDLVMSNEVETIDTKAFSGLFSLKKLHVPLNAEKNITDVKLSSLQRVDYFQGPVYFLSDGVNVIKTLNLIGSGGHMTGYLEHRLQHFVYAKNILNLDVRNLNSKHLLKNLSKFHITNLNIVDANISVLERDIFNGFDQLKSLKIEVLHSVLRLEQGVFNNLSRLENLKLSYLKLHLRPGIFKKLFNLKKLFLQNANGEKEGILLTRGIFSGLTNLKYFRLFDTIYTVHGSTFLGFENLKRLDMQYNTIYSLETGSFHGIKNTREINLKHNVISTIGPGVFGALCDDKFKLTCENVTKISKFCNISFVLESLEILDMSNNKITFIHQHAFLGCSKLHTLILSFNKIQIIDFLYTPQLSKLQFQGNNYTIIHNTTFLCTSQITELDFLATRVQDMDLSPFQNLRSLKKFKTPRTECNCRFRKLWQWLRSNRVNYQYNFICAPLIQNIDAYFTEHKCNGSDSQYYKPRNDTSALNNYLHFRTYIEPIVFIFIFLSGCFGNGIILFVIFYHAEMRNKTNVCIAQLAIADILSLILNLMLSYWDVVHVNWELDELSCKVFVMSKDLVLALVVFTVLVLTLERFLVVRSSFKLKAVCGLKYTGPTLFLLIVWIFVTVTSIPSYMNATVNVRCLSFPPGEESHILRLWTFQLWMYCILPVISVLILNVATAYTLKKSLQKVAGKIGNEKRDRNRNTVANIISVLSIVFTLSYVPNFVIRTLVSWSVWNKEDVFWYSFVSYCLFFLHTIFSPFALFSMGSKYKSHIMAYIRRFTKEKNPVSQPRHVKRSERVLITDGQILLNLEQNHTASNQNLSSQEALVTLENDIIARDEAVRKARQERLNKLQLRFL